MVVALVIFALISVVLGSIYDTHGGELTEALMILALVFIVLDSIYNL